MPVTADRAVRWEVPPAGLDTIAADLRSLRAAAGEPSYAEIGRRVAELRGARGMPRHERRIPRTTVFDCFRDGRRRIDVDAVTEIALALGLPRSELARWAERLRLARAAADGAAVAVARDQPPAPVPYFAGRDAELETLVHLMAQGGRAWISGMAGAGKTQLVLRLAQRLGQDALFLDLRGHDAESPPVEAAAAQRAVLRVLGLDEHGDADERLARMLDGLRGERRLLVLDDALGWEQVDAVLGSTPPARVVVTSRTGLDPAGTGWRHLPMQGLDRDAVALALAAMADDVRPTAAEAERLAEVTGGLPLAIALVGGRLATHRGWTLDEHVELMARRLESGRVDPDLRAELDLSYGNLGEEARALLRSFADVPLAEIGGDKAAVLLGVDDAGAVVAELAGKGLAIRRADSRIALHSLVRAYARERGEDTDPPRQRAETFSRLGQHLAERAWAAYATIAEGLNDSPRRSAFAYPRLTWSPEEATRWLRTNLSSLLTFAHVAGERGRSDLLFRISEGLSWWLNLSGHHVDALRLHEAAADLAAEVGDSDALAMASLDAGQLLVMSDRPEEAREHFRRAMRLVADVEELSDPGLVGVITNMSALLDLRAGRVTQAVEAFRRAAALHEERGETVRQISALTNLGVALHAHGDFEQEREVIERAFVHARDTDNSLFQAHLWVNRAAMHLELGDLDAALDDATRASAAADEVGVPYIVATARLNSAEALRRKGALDDAITAAEQALTTARRVGADFVVIETLLGAARIHLDRGATERVRELVAEVEQMLPEEGDDVLRGHLLRLRSELADDPTARQEYLDRAVAAYEAVGSFHARALRGS